MENLWLVNDTLEKENEMDGISVLFQIHRFASVVIQQREAIHGHFRFPKHNITLGSRNLFSQLTFFADNTRPMTIYKTNQLNSH